MRVFTSALIPLVLLSFGTSVRAQSLADAAKKEEERRKETKSSARTYTNRDLPAVPSLPAPPAADDPQASSAAQPEPAAAAAPPPASAAAPAPVGQSPAAVAAPPGAAPSPAAASLGANGRELWQGRIQKAREQLERDRVLYEALQTRTNSLNSDIVNRDDPAQRAKLMSDRSRTLLELERLKKAIAADEKAVPAIEEEARRAGVPPGWLR